MVVKACLSTPPPISMALNFVSILRKHGITPDASLLIPSTNMAIPKALLRHTYSEACFNSLGSSFRGVSCAQ